MDKSIRNTLRNTVTQCRKILEESVYELLQGQFGIHKEGKIEDKSSMTHLSPEDQEYREEVIDHIEHIKSSGFKVKEAIGQLVRETAFTHLNRVCAYKMLEERKLIRGAVNKGLKSNGFMFYLADHPEDEKLWSGGKQDTAYRHFLEWLGGTLTEEIGVLFSTLDPAKRLFPPQRVLEEILALINNEELSHIWLEDETIGWIYQYFTPRELIDKARKESQAPRNSYELAFRNQFYTPRYVVEFLVDNTLGRTWYEMSKGNTSLKEKCRYLVIRPNEIFMKKEEEPPETEENTEDLSQEELLKLPVYITHREKKDPRDIKILDPACGSGHFLLYCFDLLETIYEEAYADKTIPPFTETGKTLGEEYPDRETFKKSIPALILRYNLHGIDIDLRATQIATLALWLRAQKAYQDMEINKKERPKITKSNIVCAEPMPGNKEMLEEFTSDLQPNILGQLVKIIFDRMELAGEAGSLLKIEEEIKEAIERAKKQWDEQPKAEQMALFPVDEPLKEEFDITGITDESFWEKAEIKVLEALGNYASEAANGKGHQRKLFAEDAVQGFAFIDLCRKRFDVVVMNPPFGETSRGAKDYIIKYYPVSKHDLACSFVERWLGKCVKIGKLGAITTRTPFFLSSATKWREEIILKEGALDNFADLGDGVLDAMVETVVYTLSNERCEFPGMFLRLLKEKDKGEAFLEILPNPLDRRKFTVNPGSFLQVPNSPMCYWVSEKIRRLFKILPPFQSQERLAVIGLSTSDDFRFLRNWWEVSKNAEGRTLGETERDKRWVPFSKGGAYSPYYYDVNLMINWQNNGKEIKEWVVSNSSDPNTTHWSRRIANSKYYFQPGLTWPRRTTSGISLRTLPEGCIFADKGPVIFASELMNMSGVLNSSAFEALLTLQVGAAAGAARSYEVGLMQRTPVPEYINPALGDLASKCFNIKRKLDTINETSRIFTLPETCQSLSITLNESNNIWQEKRHNLESEFLENQKKIDALSFDLYEISDEDRKTYLEEQDRTNKIFTETTDNIISVQNLISWCAGVFLGRWDVRLATGEREIPEPGDPFAPLPVYSPGMLTEIPENYPIEIDLDGVLVDDENHSDDIVRRTRDVLQLLWKENTESIEKEVCEILGVKNLREYFRKPGKGGFWDDHIKRYSKSKRKAPIYWLLQSSKKNYALWIYYHRLDKDILFKALEKYVRPKIQHEENILSELRAKKGLEGLNGGEVKRIEKELEKEEDFILELNDFREKLERAAKLYLEPDLNDGVVLNIAPLWEVVPWNEAKKYWDELVKGKYEWSSIGKQLREQKLVKSQT